MRIIIQDTSNTPRQALNQDHNSVRIQHETLMRALPASIQYSGFRIQNRVKKTVENQGQMKSILPQ